MKRKRFSIEQIVAVLKQAELGMPVADVIRQVGISEQTFYRWKKQYAGMQSDQARELKQLQEENARLKKLVAELSLDKAILRDVASKRLARPALKRMRLANPHGVCHRDRSQWRACDQGRQFGTRSNGAGGAESSAAISRAVLGSQFQGSSASRSRFRAVGMRCRTSVM